jgi:DNA-binding IclR family transcriptional regulator
MIGPKGILPAVTGSDSAGGVQVIARAAQVLRALEGEPQGLSLAQLSAVHRMADAAWRSSLTGLRPPLEELARTVGETVDLSVLDRDRVTIADQVTSSQRLRAVNVVGESVPLHCTASGKVFLAAMDQAALTQALPGTLARLTPATITDPSVLAAELALTRARGYALDREEHADGICGTGVFLGLVADVPAAVSVPVPAQRFYGREHVVATVLLGWAAEIRQRLAAR